MRLLFLFLISASGLTSLPLSAQIGLYPHTPSSNIRQEPGAPDAQPLAALSFPDLLIDSLSYNNLSSSKPLTRQYKYNRQEQLVEEWEHALDDIRTIYTYDAQGRRQGNHRYRYVPSGIFEDSTVYTYDGMGRLIRDEFLVLKNGEWQAKHRSTFSYEPDGAVVKLMETQGNGAWQQVSRNSTLKRPERALADYDWEEVRENG